MESAKSFSKTAAQNDDFLVKSDWFYNYLQTTSENEIFLLNQTVFDNSLQVECTVPRLPAQST